MQWLIIVRRRGRRQEGVPGPNVELPGEFDGMVYAADRATALTRARASRPAIRVDVIAQVSWNQMGANEKKRLLGLHEPAVSSRASKSACAVDVQGAGAQQPTSPGLHCARKVSVPRRSPRGPARSTRRPS